MGRILSIIFVYFALSSNVSADEVIATGQYGQLTRDNAMALLDATEFVLQQIDMAHLLADLDKELALQEMAKVFPSASAEEQIVLTQAQMIWQQAQMMWPQMSMDDKYSFAYDVLTLSLGEANAAQLLGVNQQGQSAGSSGYNGGMPSIDQGYEGSDCWASAGCDSYESDTGTYNYESYDSYDSYSY